MPEFDNELDRINAQLAGIRERYGIALEMWREGALMCFSIRGPDGRVFAFSEEEEDLDIFDDVRRLKTFLDGIAVGAGYAQQAGA